MAALKTLSVLCTVGQWKQATLRQTWSVNTFSKKIHFHFAMHSAAARQQTASFVNFQFISNSSFENVPVCWKAGKFSLNRDCAQLKLLLVVTDESGNNNWLRLSTQVKLLNSLLISTCAFCFFLVGLLTHNCLGEGFYLTTQLNGVGVCVTCAGMETVWKDPTAPPTCKHLTPLATEKAAAPGLQCSGNNSTAYPAIYTYLYQWETKELNYLKPLECGKFKLRHFATFFLTILSLASGLLSFWY